MISFPKITQEKLLQRLAHPGKKVRMVLDTDTYNEIDDQFAVVYALKSPEQLQIEAFYAAPFHNELSDGPADGMEKSYRELQKISALLPEMSGIPIYRGSTGYLSGAETPQESDAARNLVERAMASPEDDPLYVVAIGAITNVASAILMEPSIIEKIVVVWLGGHSLPWPDTKEFNLAQDLHASRTVLNCGVPLVLIPCMGVTSHLLTTLSEVREFVKDQGEIGKYLYETYENCAKDHFAYSRVIWDIATIAYLINESWLPNELVHSPILSEDFRYSFDASRHFIRYIHFVRRDRVFKDFFSKLGS
ncbi:nucleoside hydrolase [Paenibacillus sp. CGMCC 1.16610]|uniref:Nucleoside hydrolase n=1 Tax=Paenibacillus anseongense TaxID=2682845 RepID=A0ABW9U1Z9_9BACL|nr:MULTISPECIES: nucleoside hydrolase [Paenibacillus]MBA2940929.1 nucleoside hydrolase [Paenibacillus sp. CGMCC 1.16610]MVQ34112.1 nucleoside hydrolase [Paenibacillus anseongense]